jgi:hypothetical protein
MPSKVIVGHLLFLSLLLLDHEVSHFVLPHGPTMMYSLAAGPKQGVKHSWTATSKTVSQINYFSL